MTADFVYESLPQRVVFGAGKRRTLGDEVRRLHMTRVFVVAETAGGRQVADDLANEAGFEVPVRWSEAVQHVPETLADRARSAATDAGIDGLVSVGGGSSTGLAKAIALSHGVPIIAVPTTYAGSEQTAIYGITGGRHKQTGKDPRVQPRTVIYDPELTYGLPAAVTGPSAFNALAHSVEALYAPGHNPVISALAMEGVRAIHRSLPTVMAQPSDPAARSDLLYGAYLSGMALGATAAAIHHKICHVLGGAFNLVHADSHSVILPHAIAFNAPALPAEMAMLAEALHADADDTAGALWDLAVASNVPTSLQQLGLKSDDLAEVAALATAEISGNPREFTQADMLGLLERAFAGARPQRTAT
ncbi:MAG: Maleylacetate reductase [Ilumatobacteraceae bacterium]|nr:Maleylacetate reductase [Ilumatobacteraceae bacterium]